MNILFVTPMLPSVAGGAPTRTFNLLKQLAIRHKVSVISLVQPSERGLLPALEPYCHRIELVDFQGYVPLGKWHNRLVGWWRLLFDPRPQYVRTYPVEAMREPLDRVVRELDPDFVHFAHLYTAELLLAVDDRPVSLDEHNAEFDNARRQTIAHNYVHRVRGYLTWRKLLRFERHWVRRFPVCVAVSQRDADLLQEMAPSTEFYVVPNGVDCGYFAQPPSLLQRDQKSLIFVGTMNYRPNVDGVLFFCHEIWPLVRRVLPDARLTIVGSRPVPEVVELQDRPGVTVTGFVDDVRPYFWQAAASVVPLRMGGGTRLKIVESLAAGCPVVSTTIGAEGLNIEPNEDYLLADDPQEFAAGVVQLLTDSKLSNQIACHGQETVRRFYDWQTIGKRLEAAYQRAVETYGCCKPV